VKGRNTPLETAKTARKICRGNEEKELCIIGILLLIDTVRGIVLSVIKLASIIFSICTFSHVIFTATVVQT